MFEHEATPAREKAAAADPLSADLAVSDETAVEVAGGGTPSGDKQRYVVVKMDQVIITSP